MIDPHKKNKDLVLKEYGRNTQNLINYLVTIEDKAKRTELAHVVIDLMKHINPSSHGGNDHTQKLWDHLYIMADFKLDVDTEHPMPDKSILDRKPQYVPYNMNQLKFKHYGKNIELLINKAIERDSPQEIEESVIYIGRLMKRFYSAWNKENVEDDVILQQLHIMSRGKLSLPIERIKSENLFDISLTSPSKDFNKFNSLYVNYPDKELVSSIGGKSYSSNGTFQGNNNKKNNGNNKKRKK
jgi:hypothetical protein